MIIENLILIIFLLKTVEIAIYRRCVSLIRISTRWLYCIFEVAIQLSLCYNISIDEIGEHITETENKQGRRNIAMDERLDPTLTYKTEYEEWCRRGCEKARSAMESFEDTEEELS